MLGTLKHAVYHVARGVASAACDVAASAAGWLDERLAPTVEVDEDDGYDDDLDLAQATGVHEVEDEDGWTWVHVPPGIADEALEWLNSRYETP